MGKMTLDLDDRSARLIHGHDVWTEIGDLLSGYSDIQAVFGQVGSDADQLLPLRGPACIVVDAGPTALQAGTTDPDVLLGWTRRGVRVYSLPGLHAKVILASGSRSFVLVGSADLTRSAAGKVGEAVLVADEPDTVEEVRSAIDGWKQRAGDPLTDDWLQSAVERYRPPPPQRHVERVVELPTRRHAPPRTNPAWPAASAAQPPQVVAAHSTREAQSPPIQPPRVQPQPSPAQPAVPAHEPTATESPLTPAAVSESSITSTPIVSAEPGAFAPPIAEPSAASQPQWASADDDELGVVGPVSWARPKYIYLAPLSRDGRASLSALERLRHLKGEHRVRSEHDGRPVLEVEMFWRDEPAKAPAKPNVSYREGWHVVPIQLMGTVRPTTSSQMSAPGRVLQSYTDYSAHPARTYYYLLTYAGGRTMTFRALRDVLAGLGERASFDHAYMMQHKVDAILELWPEIGYTD